MLTNPYQIPLIIQVVNKAGDKKEIRVPAKGSVTLSKGFSVDSSDLTKYPKLIFQAAVDDSESEVESVVAEPKAVPAQKEDSVENQTRSENENQTDNQNATEVRKEKLSFNKRNDKQ